jgi:hypothetical protein
MCARIQGYMSPELLPESLDPEEGRVLDRHGVWMKIGLNNHEGPESRDGFFFLFFFLRAFVPPTCGGAKEEGGWRILDVSDGH